MRRKRNSLIFRHCLVGPDVSIDLRKFSPPLRAYDEEFSGTICVNLVMLYTMSITAERQLRIGCILFFWKHPIGQLEPGEKPLE